MRKLLRWFPVLLAFALLAGCAAPEPKRFTYGDLRPEDLRRLLWPPSEDGAVPRYVFNGLVVGEENFIRKGEASTVKFEDVMRFLIGVELSSYETPKFLYRPSYGVVDEAGGRIVVTDIAWKAIFVFDTNGAGGMQVWREIGDEDRLASPTGLALGLNGEIFVSDSTLGEVFRFDKSGKLLQRFGKGHLQRPTGLAYNPLSRRLYVADTYAHQIKVFDASGTLLDEWGDRGGDQEVGSDKTGRDVGGLTLNYPTHIAYKRDKLYVTDTMNARVHVLSAETGRTITVIGRRGVYVGNMVRPKGVAVDSEENIYVVEGYHDHLLIFNRQGQFLMAIGGSGNGPGKFSQPSGVWIDSRDRVFVADSENSRVQVFQFLGGGDENTQ